MYAELHGVPSERAIPAQRRAHGTLPSLHQNPARVKAVGAVDNLDLLEALTSGRFLYDLWLASADLAVAYLVEVVRGAHAFALVLHLVVFGVRRLGLGLDVGRQEALYQFGTILLVFGVRRLGLGLYIGRQEALYQYG